MFSMFAMDQRMVNMFHTCHNDFHNHDYHNYDSYDYNDVYNYNDYHNYDNFHDYDFDDNNFIR